METVETGTFRVFARRAVPSAQRQRENSECPSFLFLLVLLLAGTFARAAPRSLEIERFAARLDVLPEGVVRVEERIAIDFRGSWNGIYREIPFGFTDRLGVRGTIALDVQAVEDGVGGALRYEESRGKGRLRLKIHVPVARDAKREVVIRYLARGALRRVAPSDEGYGLHDELYWNVTGDEWQVPIHEATAEVRLPAGIALDAVRRVAYTGERGSRGEDAESRLEGEAVVFKTSRPLGPHAGLTIAVGFPPGQVQYPSLARRAGWLVRANWYVVLPLLVVVSWWMIWRRRGRDSLGARTIIPEWEPPLGLRPTEVGALIDDSMDQRDLTAGIFDLAVRGVIKIREVEDSARDFVLVLNEQAPGAKLETFEEALIDGLFGGKSQVRLSALSRKFFRNIDRVNDKVLDDLVVKGLLRARPDRVRAGWVGLTVAALVGLAALGGGLAVPAPFWVALVLAAPVMLAFAWRMPQRTQAGLDALAHVKGMEEYLVTAERERLDKLPLELIESLLPYAIALDLSDRWTTLFAGLFERPPEWYEPHGQGVWAPHALGQAISGLNRSVSSTLYAVPRTEQHRSHGWGGGYSGGSGFSRGGGSGGGFGGGGGGGF